MIRISIIAATLAISATLFAQQVESIDRQGLSDLLKAGSEPVRVINFWATWCAPCVREIGYFEELHRSSGENLEVILINLDFPNQVEKRVLPFLEERNISAPVLNMTELDYNSWIPLIHESWSGAIPATLIIKESNRKFIPGELTKEELLSAIQEIEKQ